MAGQDQYLAAEREAARWHEAKVADVGEMLLKARADGFADRMDLAWWLACEHVDEIAPKRIFAGGLPIAIVCRRRDCQEMLEDYMATAGGIPWCSAFESQEPGPSVLVGSGWRLAASRWWCTCTTCRGEAAVMYR